MKEKTHLTLGALLSLATLLVASTVLAAADDTRTVEITVTDRGYEPSRIELENGESVRLSFTNKAKSECAASVESEELGIERTELPPGKTTVIEITAERPGEFTFACSMGMLKGTVVVAAREG